MELKYALVLILSLGVFLLVRRGNEKLAIKVVVFFLSFAATPFRSDGIFVGLSGIMIVAAWIGILLGKQKNAGIPGEKALGLHLKFLYYFLFGGIVLALLQTEYQRDTATDIPASVQILNYSMYLAIIIIFIKMMMRHKHDRPFHYELMYVFVLSAFAHFVVIALTIFGYNNLVPAFLVSSAATNTDDTIQQITVRYSGLIGDYELLVDYCMMLIGLAVVLLFRNEHRLISALGIVAAFISALATGTRSFIVIVAVFGVITFLLHAVYYFDPRKVVKIVVLMAGVWICAMYVYTRVFPEDIIFRRLAVAYDLLVSGDIEQASNRNITAALPDLVGSTGILGYGSVFLSELNNDATVSHSVLLASYAKYGIVGLFAVLLLFFRSFTMSLNTIKKSTTVLMKDEAIVMFALAIALFLQELKISALRILPSMLIYTLFFLLVWFLAIEAGVASKPLAGKPAAKA